MWVLGPDVKRAAPEIYVGCLSEGSRSIREWTEINFHTCKNTELWVEVWDRASQVDFLASKLRTDEALLKFFGSDDTCEVHLRRLASLQYKKRTGDRTGALAMLGIKAPGTTSDVAPHWLVQEVAAYSTAEHKRELMVEKGKGKGDKNNGDKDQDAQDKGKGARGGGAAQAAS